MRLRDLQTPSLLLDEVRMKRNVERLKKHLATARIISTASEDGKEHRCRASVDANRQCPATVSTLAEAEQFATEGVKDILYAVGIAPNKLDRLLAIRRRGVDVSIILDSLEQADFVAAKSARQATRSPP